MGQKLVVGHFNSDETEMTRLGNIVEFLNVQDCNELLLEEGEPPIPEGRYYYSLIAILHRICIKINNLEEA